MINFLTGKYRKTIAWFLFFVFYGELAITLHASNRRPSFYPLVPKTGLHYIPVNDGLLLNAPGSFTAIERTEEAIGKKSLTAAAKVETVNKPGKTDELNIGGPGQPEMNTFKSVGADNMVNLFTGDFSYNIPLLDVGGYPVNIFYNAGIGMDQEASWVGLGWNINPGTISRNMRGLPDDYNGEDSVTKVQSIKPDLTVGVTASKGLETTGVPNLSASLSAGIFYNNRRGLGLEFGANADYSIYKDLAIKAKDECTLKETSNVGMPAATFSGGINLNSQNGMSLNAGFSVYKYNTQRLTRQGLSTSIGYNSRQGLTDFQIDAEYRSYEVFNNKNNVELRSTGSASTQISNINFARSSFTPSIRMPLTVFNQRYSLKIGSEKKVWYNNIPFGGYVQESRIAPKDTVQKKPAYGFAYYEKAKEDVNALMDFNRLNDGVYTLKKPVISVPVYTYDVFNISGEGTGGSFRAYRGNTGYVRDHQTYSRSTSFSISLDVGGGDMFHVGAMLGGVFSKSTVQEWKINNAFRPNAVFEKSKELYEGFYFKNPGEKAIIDGSYYDNLGADKLIRPFLENTNTATPYLSSGFQVIGNDRKVESIQKIDPAIGRRNIRDKRTQVITYFTAEDADRIGLDRMIYSYTENVFKPGSCPDPEIKTGIMRYNPDDPAFYRKKHHISEIDVLEADGRRYMYGIPVYQVKQKEVTFSTETTPQSPNNLIAYTSNGDNPDNSVKNNKGRDGFYESETVNGYAHSFLLTGILSPDYTDITGDGITDDDLGTAIKFNYSRVDKKRNSQQNGNYWDNFKWRLPAQANMANYNEGLKADSRDDKGLYTYGEKELWYMHSIESKNMVATFQTSIRNDGKQVNDENGGLSAAPGQRKLDKINLYTKADYLKYGSNAKPVKTVHFQYSYKLCPGFSLNSSSQDGGGKLTLEAIWFSYNGNNTQVKNKYRFKYSTSNPAYNSVETDRWGTYKSHLDNPDQADNNDYSYTLQDATKSNSNAAAWNLEQILLPGGAIMKVQYEADDYAFVQDKRACQMTSLAGFGKSANSTPVNALYTFNLGQSVTPALMDNRFVFFDIVQSLPDKPAIASQYLQNIKQLLLKLWVKMPRGNIGNQPAYEPVIVYSAIKDYGFAINQNGTENHSRFYIEMEPTGRGGSPVMETVMQFLKDQLPGRAYPGYEVNGDGALKQVVRSVFGLMNAYFQGVMGFEKNLKAMGKCREVQLNRSFARLNNPGFKKIGGGHRVKKIVIDDNWDRMTTVQHKSEYGQIYDYTNSESVNGQKLTISSGVAAYEPGVGNEENPFREILKYSERQFLGPTDYSNVELPFAETFFPSPMVGYSRVSVKSIHNKEEKNIKSGIGLQQTEFYTTRDFPVITSFSDFDNYSRHHHKPGVLQKIFNYDKKDYMTLTQGFRIVLNDMNGKMKSQTSYAENDYTNPINYTANYYRTISRGNNKYSLDNVLPVISNPDGIITNKLIGKDVEVMNDSREHFTYTYAANIPINVEVFTVGAFPMVIPTLFRMAFHDESRYRSATTLKVVNEYGILDSVVNIDKGSVVGTKNLVYDAESGDVLISRTNNEFKKPVYQFSYPAWWVHSGMEPAYRNIDLNYTNVLFRNGRIEESSHVNMDFFESGDELLVDHDNKAVPQSLGCITGGGPLTLPASAAYKIWAIDVRKDTRNTEKDFIFLDREGNPYNAINATIRIIRSGKRNMTGASAGSIVSLSNPIRLINNQERVLIDNNTDVINAGAAEFKERWRANDQFYAQYATVRTVRQAPIYTTTYAPSAPDHILEYLRKRGKNQQHLPYHYTNTDYFVARQHDEGGNHSKYNQKSWLLYDFTGIGNNTTILSAKLTLVSHQQYHSFEDQQPSHDRFNPHVGYPQHRNDFRISRMFSSWPVTNAGWEAIFNTEPPGYYNQVTKRNVSPMQSFQFNPGGPDERLDVTGLVTGMIRDKYDPAKNFATGIKLSLEHIATVDKPARVCFWSKDLSSYEDQLYYAPRIEVKHYTCTASNPIVFQGDINDAPVTPPPGFVYCPSDETGKYCFSVFSKQIMNPYIEGVLGNWRGWKSYVYYGERRESDPAAITDIRKDGVIKDYENYWSLATAPGDKLGKTGSTKWVWNAEITQYNRKGAELENHDPLGRYNAGIYGYQESLPVAVVNNSRLRLSAFDGFEDYYYKDDPCEPFCKPAKRHLLTGLTTEQLNETESHSGRYSVKINPNTTYQLSANVSADDEVSDPDIRIKIDKTPYEGVVKVMPSGIGLKGYYYNNTTFTAPASIREDKTVNLLFESRKNGNCKPGNNPDYSPYQVGCTNISVRWKGKIQVEKTGEYYFDIPTDKIDDIGYVYINNTLVVTSILGGQHTVTPINLTAGTLHDIQVDFVQTQPNWGKVQLYWKQPGSFTLVPVPSTNLYPEGKENLADGSTQTETVYCIKPDIVQAIDHHLIDGFNLIPGKKMVASVWMKKGGPACNCSSYTSNFDIRDVNGVLVASFVPKENIIEGWQQFEAIFTVPSSIAQLKFNFPADAGVAFYIDDLRIHPYNANMKSFVYDPVTLRLAAELDENNYASFYEYDDDGGLIRVKKETKEGIKTITETRSAVQKRITDF